MNELKTKAYKKYLKGLHMVILNQERFRENI